MIEGSDLSNLDMGYCGVFLKPNLIRLPIFWRLQD